MNSKIERSISLIITLVILFTVLPACTKKDKNTVLNNADYYISKTIMTNYNSGANSDETLIQEDVFRQDGQKVKTTTSSLKVDADSTVSSAIYKYDDNNRLIQITASEQNEAESTVVLNYIEQNGNQVGRGKMYENGKYSGYMEYTYNSNHLIKKSVFNESDELINYELFDVNGHLIESYAKMGGTNIKYQYEYDQKGNQIKVTYFFDNVMDSYDEYEYTDGKFVKGASYNKNNEKKGYSIQTSSEKTTSKFTLYDANDVITGYRTLEYDDFGNLIKTTGYTKDNEIIQINENFWSKGNASWD